MTKGQRELTDEDTVVRRVGEDDGIAEQSGGGVSGGGGGCSHTSEQDTVARSLLCGGCSVSGAGHTELLGLRFRYIMRGWSWEKELEESL